MWERRKVYRQDFDVMGGEGTKLTDTKEHQQSQELTVTAPAMKALVSWCHCNREAVNTGYLNLSVRNLFFSANLKLSYTTMSNTRELAPKHCQLEHLCFGTVSAWYI